MLIIKELRKKNKESQSDLGEAIGLSLRTIQHYESGSVDVPVKSLELIAKHYDVSIAYLLNNKNGENSSNSDDIPEYIGKNDDFKIDDFLDIFFLYKDKIEKHPRFEEYISSIEKDAIIDYQHRLLTAAKKVNG